MNLISFSWDEQKNQSNKKKHSVSFEEAQLPLVLIPLIIKFSPEGGVPEGRGGQQRFDPTNESLKPMFRWCTPQTVFHNERI